MVRMAERFRQNPAILGNGLIIVGIAALAGGRLYHVIDQWQALYAADPIKIFLPPYAGLGIFGGFITGAIAVIALARYHKVSFWRWADIVAPGHLRDAGRGAPRQLLQPGAVRPADDPAGRRDRL